jgi:uncharacterized OB-fold protein
MASDIYTNASPLTPFIMTAVNGEHYLAGSRCRACGKIFVGERRICASCCARDKMDAVRLADSGKVYAFTIVNRSFPGVKTPFIDVTVDLDDGAHIKGTLEGVEPKLEAIMFDMPVKLAYREAVPVSTAGTPYLTYVFVPA